jgi:hypothetical protein
VGWSTVASEIGDIERFPSPPSSACRAVGQRRSPRPDLSTARATRGWALFEAALHACKHPVYAERYQRTRRRLGRRRGPTVAQIDLSRKLTETIWHMITRNEPFAPGGAGFRLALTALFGTAPPQRASHFTRSRRRGAIAT